MELHSTQFQYSIQAQAKSEWLQNIFNCTNNASFLSLFLEHPLFSKLNSLLQEHPNTGLDDLKETIISLIPQQNKDEVRDLIIAIYSVFVRENCTGPSVYTEYVEETKKWVVKGGPLPQNILDPISNKNESLQEKLLAHFERDGESIYHKTQFLVLFYALQVVLDSDVVENTVEDSKLWKARFYILYDSQLTSSVVHLKDQSIALYEQYITALEEKGLSEEGKKELSALLIEQSHCYLNFYKYKEAKNCIKKAMQMVGLVLKLTGKLGRRTKFQEFDIAQLVLDVDNREVLVKTKDEEQNDNAQKLLLEEETILFETPKITNPLDEIAKKELSVFDQLIITAYVNYSHKTHPKDETQQELLQPYINIALEKSNNWLVFSQLLLLRSRNEFDRSKLKERSLLQVQTLIDQYKDKEPSFGTRVSFFPSTNYPLLWQLQKELAKNYMSMGVFISAYELLKEVELFEDCVSCLFMGGRRTEAEQLANEQIAKQKSPAILCLLGDIKKDVSYYYKAWEESGHKYARAMRSIGRQHFFTGEYKKSIESYETALAINRLYGDAWFTLGCAYMRIEDWKGAIYSFGVAVSIDEHNHDAWCNISSCYLKQGKEKEAILCIEQALKQNRKNWKIWENYIIFSLETKNFHKALTGARELIRSDKTDRVNATLVKKICDVFLRNYFAQECPPNEFIVHKKQLYLFFDEYTDKIAKDSQVYNIIGKVKNVLGEPMEVIKEYKLKEIRALMCIGWENEIDTCEKLENALNQLIAIYEGKPLPEEEKVFIKNTIISIEKCLQRKCTVSQQ